MSVFSGKQDTSGPKNGRRNKGVMAAHRAKKRAEAEARKAISDAAYERFQRMLYEEDRRSGMELL